MSQRCPSKDHADARRAADLDRAAGLDRLVTRWMNGVLFYLDRDGADRPRPHDLRRLGVGIDVDSQGVSGWSGRRPLRRCRFSCPRLRLGHTGGPQGGRPGVPDRRSARRRGATRRPPQRPGRCSTKAACVPGSSIWGDSIRGHRGRQPRAAAHQHGWLLGTTVPSRPGSPTCSWRPTTSGRSGHHGRSQRGRCRCAVNLLLLDATGSPAWRCPASFTLTERGCVAPRPPPLRRCTSGTTVVGLHRRRLCPRGILGRAVIALLRRVAAHDSAGRSAGEQARRSRRRATADRSGAADARRSADRYSGRSARGPACRRS